MRSAPLELLKSQGVSKVKFIALHYVSATEGSLARNLGKVRVKFGDKK